MTDVPDAILDEETEERYLHLIFQTKNKDKSSNDRDSLSVFVERNRYYEMNTYLE